MKRFFLKPYRWAIIFSVLLIGSVTYVLLDTFVIPKSYAKVVTDTVDTAGTSVSTDSSGTSETSETTDASETTDSTNTSETTDATVTSNTQTQAVVTDTSYEDENIKISIDKVYEYDTAIYIADVQISDLSFLQTALADDTYGRNIKETTSEIAESNNAILAINGDFYGFRNSGYVLRNGILYRDTAGDNEALVIDDSGDFSIINESETSLDSLNLDSIWQVLSFGPALIEEGEVVVDNNSEVSRSMNSNPRTAIGMISPLHYIIVVADGRTSESAGLSLKDLAQVFADEGCTTAYNLDGGGSTTMYFNGEIVNIPTDGNFFGEREVSDIVYIRY